LVFAFILAGALLYFTLRNLDWSAFWEAITGGQYLFLLFTIPLGSINYFIRSTRWSTLVGSGKKTSLFSIFWANMVGYLGNAYLPARLGEIIRSVYLGQISGEGGSFIFATALVERLLDVIALVLIGTASMLLQSQISSLVKSAVSIMAIAGGIGLAIIVILPFQENWISAFLLKLPLPNHLGRKITEQIARFLVGMRSLQNLRSLGLFFLLTVMIWLLDGLGNVIGVHIIGQTLTLGQALILLAALGLSSAIPSTPGSIGIYQFVAISVLVPFGFSRPQALAYILISQVANYGVVSFWGLIGLWRINTMKGKEAGLIRPA
jgi:glycosyltransferase 2 family protein